MRVCVVVTSALLIVLLLSPSRSHAQSRVSVEIGGVVSAYDISSPQAGVTRGAITQAGVARSAITLPSGTGGNGTIVSGGPSMPAQGIAAFEVRPTVTLDSGFLMGVGFRAGQAGLGDGGTSLVGGDLSLGYAHRFGRFLPFVKGMFGFNSYDVNPVVNGNAHQTDLRLDAVVGSRLYVTNRMFLALAAFAGFGDRYGGTLSVGGDVIQVFRRGVMP